MKKLLILMLVLGLASSANAALTLVSSAGDTLQPGGVTMIGIHNDVAAAGQGLTTYLAIPTIYPAGWTGAHNIYAPPSLGMGPDHAYYGVMDIGGSLGMVDLWASDYAVASAEPYGIGVLGEYEFSCTGLGEVVVTLLAQDVSTVLDTITITQIPEPMTIALLGLGGLFLLRRRK